VAVAASVASGGGGFGGIDEDMRLIPLTQGKGVLPPRLARRLRCKLSLLPLCDWRKIIVAIDRLLAHATDEQEERECYSDDHPSEDGAKPSVGCPVITTSG
jgi:hypothetical protein